MSTTTQTHTTYDQPSLQLAAETLPSQFDEAFKGISKLTREQCGHVRHFHNLASQADGDWAFMGAEEPGQEWDTALRYQLSAMAYAAGAAHYHHLPAMRSLFKALIEKMIKKMLNKYVWDYWYLSSQSGTKVDPDLKELRKPWADPVVRENIMVKLRTVITSGEELFDEKDGIVFDWNPLFWGMGPERYSYTRSTLQKAILKEMERENWMGACCEPNMIFIVCNQFPILAMRYNDVTDNSHVVDDVLKKYTAAWAKSGFIGENGLFRRNYFPNQNKFGVAESIDHTVWAMAFMPWNYEKTQPLYPSIADGYLEKVESRTNIRPPSVALVTRKLAAEKGGRHDDPSIVEQAREAAKGKKPSNNRYLLPTFGKVALWMSEYGEPSDLEAAFSTSGLFYERSDTSWDDDGNYTYVEPFTGNAGIAYARLNVKNGQKKMWDKPWTKADLERRPYIDDVYLAQGIDCLRGDWDEKRRAMVATFRSWDGSAKSIKPSVKNLRSGTYGVYVDGRLRNVETVRSPTDIVVGNLEVGGEEVDLVVLRI
ncbi:hypothetical protein MMC13_007298 [Lambiella insularis]|nr:hypothetical protein [Lambiella insularis]